MNFETWLQSDLTKPLKVQALHGVFFSADNAANLIGVEVYNNGTAASLSGTCIGYAIRADGGTLTITGTVSGNKASIILPTSAYVIEGPLDIVIKVVSGSVKTTVGACRGYVQRATTDTIIDPGHVIPSLEELLAQIDACEQATTAANTAATNANSKASAANTATTRANNAAAALENMDATATTLSPGSSATANVSTVSGHYRLALGVPKGDIGPSPTITNTATTYQNSTSGTTIPTGTWQTTQPTTPQGQFLWIRTILTWDNGQTTTLYSVSRMGIDGSGSVMSVNNISPDANGNVTLPVDATPTSGSNNPVKSGGVYTEAGNLASGMAILANNNTHVAIAKGQYVYVRGHSTLDEGLYTANAAIAANATLSASNLTAVSKGGLNSLVDQFTNWTAFDAQIYDLDTSTGVSFTYAYYTKIGDLMFMCGRGISSAITISTSFTIKNLPCSRVWAGGIYLNAFSGNGADRVIQSSTSGALFRPNLTGSIISNSYHTFWLIGQA